MLGCGGKFKRTARIMLLLLPLLFILFIAFEGQSRTIIKNSLPLTGKTFVITGSLLDGNNVVNRKGLESRIEDLGGKVSGSVSRKTDYVIAGRDPGSKLGKARDLGIKVISFDDFKDMTEKTAPVAETSVFTTDKLSNFFIIYMTYGLVFSILIARLGFWNACLIATLWAIIALIVILSLAFTAMKAHSKLSNEDDIYP